MPVAWTTPRTWVANEVPGETEFNTHVRDNLNYLFAPSFHQIITASGGAYSITATTAVPIDTANLSITLTTYGGNVHFHFAGLFSGQGFMRLGMEYDGSAVYHALTGLTRLSLGGLGASQMGQIDGWITGLASGSHVFRPTWFMATGITTGQLQVNSVPAILWVREG